MSLACLAWPASRFQVRNMLTGCSVLIFTQAVCQTRLAAAFPPRPRLSSYTLFNEAVVSVESLLCMEVVGLFGYRSADGRLG